MSGTTIALYSTRGLQVVFAAVALGLGAKLADDFSDAKKYCRSSVYEDFCNSILDKFVTVLAYSAFTGAFGLVDALLGSVAATLSVIPWLVPLVLDGMAAVFYLAGGINAAVKREDTLCDYAGSNTDCMQYDATTAFMFLGFVASVVAAVLVFLHQKSR